MPVKQLWRISVNQLYVSPNIDNYTTTKKRSKTLCMVYVVYCQYCGFEVWHRKCKTNSEKKPESSRPQTDKVLYTAVNIWDEHIYIYIWFSAKLQDLHFSRTGNTAVLRKAMDIRSSLLHWHRVNQCHWSKLWITEVHSLITNPQHGTNRQPREQKLARTISSEICCHVPLVIITKDLPIYLKVL